MARLLLVAFCIIALLTGKGMALKCYYCNDFDDNGPNCSTITRHSELKQCSSAVGYKTYCVSFEGILRLSHDGILAIRASSKVGKVKRCLSWETSLAPPYASCYRLDDARRGVELNGIVLERVYELIDGTQCYCNQTNGCNYNNSHTHTFESNPTGMPYFGSPTGMPCFGGVGCLRPMVALLIIFPFGAIFKVIV